MGVWRAPGARETFPKAGGHLPPPIKGLPGFRGRPNPKHRSLPGPERVFVLLSKGLRPMPPTPSASGVCMGADSKAAGCKAAGLQAAGLRAAGVKAARVALQAAGLQCRLQGLRYRLQGGPGQFAQRGGNVVLLHFEVQNSSHLSRASPSKEQNLDTLAKRTPKSGPSVVNSTRIACLLGDWGRGGPPPGRRRGGGPDPPSLSLKAQGSRPPPHAEGRRI